MATASSGIRDLHHIRRIQPSLGDFDQFVTFDPFLGVDQDWVIPAYACPAFRKDGVGPIQNNLGNRDGSDVEQAQAALHGGVKGLPVAQRERRTRAWGRVLPLALVAKRLRGLGPQHVRCSFNPAMLASCFEYAECSPFCSFDRSAVHTPLHAVVVCEAPPTT